MPRRGDRTERSAAVLQVKQRPSAEPPVTFEQLLLAVGDLRDAFAHHRAQHEIALERGIEPDRAERHAQGFMLLAAIEFLERVKIEAAPLVRLRDEIRRDVMLRGQGPGRRPEIEAEHAKGAIIAARDVYRADVDSDEAAARWIARQIPSNSAVKFSSGKSNKSIDWRRIQEWHRDRSKWSIETQRSYSNIHKLIEVVVKDQGLSRAVACERILQSLASPRCW